MHEGWIFFVDEYCLWKDYYNNINNWVLYVIFGFYIIYDSKKCEVMF